MTEATQQQKQQHEPFVTDKAPLLKLQKDTTKLEQTLGDGEGQESLVWCSPWGHKESDMTEQLTVPLLMTLKHELQNVLGEGSLDFYPTYHTDGKLKANHTCTYLCMYACIQECM